MLEVSDELSGLGVVAMIGLEGLEHLRAEVDPVFMMKPDSCRKGRLLSYPRAGWPGCYMWTTGSETR